MGKTFRTTKVLLHGLEEGSLAVGIIVSEWHGACRSDFRWAAARRIGPPPLAPYGTDQTLFNAWWALGQLLESQAQDAGPSIDL